jgi:hypothetical protein
LDAIEKRLFDEVSPWRRMAITRQRDVDSAFHVGQAAILTD